MNRWPNQQRIYETVPVRAVPRVPMCIASPTGTGKTRSMIDIIEMYQSAVLYTNRKMLLSQTASVLSDHGVEYGIRAANHIKDFSKPVQLCSVQTVDSRTLKKKTWDLPEAEIVLIDEAHVNSGDVMCELVERHKAQGARIIGFTATPLNIGHLYDDLFVAGTKREGRECGALVPAYHFAPDEPDTRKLKRQKTGEYKHGDIVKSIMTHSIVGRVIDNWRKLNPDGKPTLLFAPGVKESLWFAEQLCKQGIPAAHIDGDNVWMNGSLYESDQEARDELKHMMQGGEVEIVCNRFVLREGIDWPFVEHLILATIFGSLTAYDQVGGRGLRACSETGKTGCIIQDHGGNWHRHGSLNSDRDWSLDKTDYIMGEMREERLRKKKEIEPIRCPKCMAIRASGSICPQCGYAHTARSRPVIQHDGRLVEMRGDIYKPRRTDKSPTVADKWKRYYYRARNKGMTFNQARGLYQYENNWLSPPEGLPLMPRNDIDWFRPVNEVPMERLVSNAV